MASWPLAAASASYSSWDARLAAEAIAAFAAVLALVVLTLTIERVISGQVRGGRPQMSLLFAPTVLVMLLATSYFFILISGRRANADTPQDEIAKELAAYLFSFAGSMLALSAVGLFFIILHGVAEARYVSAHRAVHTAIVTAVFVTTMFLLFGYDDIRSTIDGPDREHWDIALWWFFHTAAIVVPVGVAANRRSSVLRRLAKSGFDVDLTGEAPPAGMEVADSVWRWFAGVIVAAIPVPVGIFLLASNATAISRLPGSVHHATASGAIWYGLLLGVCVTTMPKRAMGSSVSDSPGASESCLSAIPGIGAMTEERLAKISITNTTELLERWDEGREIIHPTHRARVKELLFADAPEGSAPGG